MAIITCDSNQVLRFVAQTCLACLLLFFLHGRMPLAFWDLSLSHPLSIPSHNIFPSQLPFDFAIVSIFASSYRSLSTLARSHAKFSFTPHHSTPIPHISTKLRPLWEILFVVDRIFFLGAIFLGTVRSLCPFASLSLR